ncbi:MAG: helix-turn-helix domain-containing protein [Pseudomonadota bacterium]
MSVSGLVGARIRRSRLDQGLKQSDLARACDISPSYLNLIEHGRRRIGGKLIADLAVALDVAPESLSAGVEAGDLVRLRAIAGAAPSHVQPEADQTDEFVLRFPGWAKLVIAQADQAAALEQRLAVMADRMRKDPVLAASIHDILSTVTAIRSTAGILAGDDPLEPAWQRRFHRNLYEESQRLATATERLSGDLEGVPGALGSVDPVEAAERWLGDWSRLTPLEGHGDAAANLTDQARHDLGEGEALTIVSELVAEWRQDAARLPLDVLRQSVAQLGLDPFLLADRLDVRLSLVLRRLAAAQELGAGLVKTDAEGAVRLRRVVPGFNAPRFGAARPLWPLYAALEQPGRAEVHTLGRGGKPWELFHIWAIAETRADGALQATMLALPATQAP